MMVMMFILLLPICGRESVRNWRLAAQSFLPSATFGRIFSRFCIQWKNWKNLDNCAQYSSQPWPLSQDSSGKIGKIQQKSSKFWQSGGLILEMELLGIYPEKDTKSALRLIFWYLWFLLHKDKWFSERYKAQERWRWMWRRWTRCSLLLRRREFICPLHLDIRLLVGICVCICVCICICTSSI